MEIIVLILGIVFTIYFITMIITSIIVKSKNLKFCILGMIVGIIVVFVGYVMIPVQSETSTPTSENTKKHVNDVAKEVINNNIESSMLKINFIDNGDNGCILLQCGEKNILIDSGRSENVNEIENALKSHSVNQLDSIIITRGDDSTMGAAAKIINDYKVQEVKYIDDSVKSNSYYNELQTAASSNGIEIDKINSKYNIGNVYVSASDIKNNVKIDFYIPESQNSLRTMSFVKDDFNKPMGSSGLSHDVSTSCDSGGDFDISISVDAK